MSKKVSKIIRVKNDKGNFYTFPPHKKTKKKTTPHVAEGVLKPHKPSQKN
ncbi:MAG: hypothetical protein M5R37_02165 [Melioribacteraceae bacterium]|nr:hypothetical protein [Melioribacteraceae bacterium]